VSHRLQVLIAEQLDRRIAKAAQRQGLSKGEWVRRALEAALRPPLRASDPSDPLDRLASLGAPAGDVHEMLADIDAGRT
jgi:hypothetical protein